MKPEEVRDLGSTIAGGGAGLWFLSTVNWAAVPFGECVKIGVGLAILAFGYLMYRKNA